jgi:hypothetical protein
VPLAIGGTAAAVSGLADTGLFVRLTRGRLWIALLALLLVGIVATNVFALSFGATASRLGQEADGLQRANSALRARLASKLSDKRVQAAAMRTGLTIPDPGSIRYVRWAPGDARAAARRLAAGAIADAPPAVTTEATAAGLTSTDGSTTTAESTTTAGTATSPSATAAPTTTTGTVATTATPTTATTVAPTATAPAPTTSSTGSMASSAAPTGGVAAP